MGSTTAALPKKLQNAITERMRLSLLRGDTPFDKARLADAAQFIGELASQRTRGRSAMAIESISDERRLTRIAIINDDMPFLVDSIAATIAALGLSIDRLVHPVIPVERDSKGKLEAIPDGDPDDAFWESMIYIEAARVDAKTRRQLQESLKETLADVRAAVTDWADVQEAMSADAARIRESDEEGAELVVRCHERNGVVALSVRDFGPGVPEEELSRIFDAFAQVDSARDHASGGYGIGLALVSRITELHNGKVVAQNQSPGLQVTLSMPVSDKKSS